MVVTLASLPDVTIRTVHWEECVEYENDAMAWKQAMQLSSIDDDEDPPICMMIPSPAFQKEVDPLLSGLERVFPSCTIFGGIASTVSSLSRARVFAYSVGRPAVVHGSGCVGVILTGDVTVDIRMAQGTKPVGGVYRVVAVGGGAEEGSCSTISAIVLDDAATAQEEDMEDDIDDDTTVDDTNKRAKLAQEYAKARIPKPPLAEANFIMRRLSDDDQAFMRRALLIGLENGNSSLPTPNELARLAKGEGYRFTVRQVASAGMKDGSVTFPLGSVNVEVGARCRFFVRDGEFAKKEVKALWTGYKQVELEQTLLGEGVNPPTGCFVYPTLDRGTKLFGKPGFESQGT